MPLVWGNIVDSFFGKRWGFASLKIPRSVHVNMPKFIARERKQKKQAKHGAQGDTIKAYPADSNIVELLPVSTAEKEKTRQRLREELRAQQPKISAKKKKRLDKYIVCV